MILSTVVLLIACANIANLLLARCTAHRSDMAVRIALGAARRRLIGQVLTESVLLSLIGGAAGLLVAYAGSHMMLALAFPRARNMPVQATPSPIVLLFAFLVSMITGIVFGTAPAWLSSHAQPADALRGVNRSTGNRSTFPQQALVVFQVALSMVLVTGELPPLIDTYCSLIPRALATRSIASLLSTARSNIDSQRYPEWLTSAWCGIHR
jgi:predicted lysophospholipase L1 biosynthesis ABC-type transport system permease subunit